MKPKFIKNQEVFSDLEECFADYANACLQRARISRQIVSLLNQLGVAVKPARARLLKRKLRAKLRLLAWNQDGKSCDTHEDEVRILCGLVEESTGCKCTSEAAGATTHFW